MALDQTEAKNEKRKRYKLTALLKSTAVRSAIIKNDLKWSELRFDVIEDLLDYVWISDVGEF
jgi:hypothetical protein